MEIPCAVLEDEQRVISYRGMCRALGQSESWNVGAIKLPPFLAKKSLLPFIGEDLSVPLSDPFEYKPKHGGRTAYGVPAELVPKICEVWINAGIAGELKTKKELETLEKAKILHQGLARIGVIALVDEATGFQKVRDTKALQGLLELYVSKEFLPHFKTFLDVFYEEIYRLKGWHYDPKKNKYQVVALYTLKYVYGCLPSAVVEKIRKETPRDKSGNYTNKLFQSLTKEVGKPHLDRVLGGVIALLKSANTWAGFERNYSKVYGKQKDQLELPLSLLDENVMQKPLPKLSSFNHKLKKGLEFIPKD